MPFLQKAASAITVAEEYVFNYVALRNPTIIYFVKCCTILFFGTFIPGYVFMVVEGTLETEFKTKMYPNTKNKLVSSLFILGNKNLAEEVYDQDSRVLLEKYEKRIAKFYDDYPLIILHLHKKVWSLWAGFFYSYTVYTTLGYGAVYPVTRVGRILTMMYGIIGIPLFLLFLTDLGKLFTKLVKYAWALIRRFYYTGSCRKKIKNVKADAFTERNMDLLTEMPISPVGKSRASDAPTAGLSEETPTTVDLSTFEVDDEFNLPILVALFILTSYIFLGALLFSYFEEWKVFDSFYYVFICFSTIGFGDFIPHNPTVEIISLFYECCGKAFMLVTVESFAERLSRSFQASLKSDSDIWSDDLGESGSQSSLDILDVDKDQSVMKILHMEMEEEAQLGIKRSIKSYHARMFPNFDNASTGKEVVLIKGDIIAEGKNKEDAVIDADKSAGDFVREEA